MSGTNILTNPSFEQPLVNDPVKGWSCQGETDDPRGGVIARYTRDNPKEGQHSGICLARLSEWAGPGQYIGNFTTIVLLGRSTLCFSFQQNFDVFGSLVFTRLHETFTRTHMLSVL